MELTDIGTYSGLFLRNSNTTEPSVNGQICYVSGTGFRGYAAGAVVTLGAAGAGGYVDWDGLYDADKTLNVDSTAFILNGTAALGAGNVLTIANAGTGKDIAGPFWSIISTTVGILELTSGGTINATGGACTIGAAATATTLAGTLVVAGTAATTSITLTAGNIVTSAGGLSLTKAANNATLSLTNNTATSASVVVIAGSGAFTGNTTSSFMTLTPSGLTSGTGLYMPLAGMLTGTGIHVVAAATTTGTLMLLSANDAFTGTGYYFRCYDGAANDFTIGVGGATAIAGTAATDVLTITAGDVVVSDGSITLADDDNAASLKVTNSAATTVAAGVVQIIADTVTTGNVIDVNADGLTNGTILHLDSTTAGWGTGLYIDCYDGAASEFSVGLDGATIITPSAAGTIGLTINSASTTGDAMNITCTALTTGDGLQITSTAETLAAGELLKIVNTEDGNATATPKTGNLASITSSVTQTTASATFDYDAMLISRSNIMNQLTFTLTASGSVLKLMNTSTNTAGTCTDSTVGLEVLMVDGGTAAPTGTAVDITSVGVAAKALNIASASTSVSDVLITGSGVKATTKAVLEVTSNGATAAGGAMLRVANTGTPAAATSYLAVFTNAGATVAANPVCVYINGKDSTAAALQVVGSGALAGGLVELNSTAGGALGAVLKFNHTPGANAEAAGDVIARILFEGQDDADAAEAYGRIDCVLRDAAAAAPDASLVFYADKAGTNTQLLALGWDTVNGATLNGALVGDGAATGIVSSQGAFDLTINTNGGTSSGTITITDAANGDITITPNGIGQTQLFAPTWQVTNKTAAATLTVAEGGVITVATAGGAFSLTLPAVATSAGLWYTFIKTDADAVAMTIDGNGAELINGAATYAAIDAQYDTATIACNGTAWYIVAKIIA